MPLMAGAASQFCSCSSSTTKTSAETRHIYETNGQCMTVQSANCKIQCIRHPLSSECTVMLIEHHLLFVAVLPNIFPIS